MPAVLPANEMAAKPAPISTLTSHAGSEYPLALRGSASELRRRDRAYSLPGARSRGGRLGLGRYCASFWHLFERRCGIWLLLVCEPGCGALPRGPRETGGNASGGTGSE